MPAGAVDFYALAIKEYFFVPAGAHEEVDFEIASSSDIGCAGKGPPTGLAYYKYAATLSPPFDAEAGTRYWVRIAVQMSPSDFRWGWRVGTQDNSRSVFNLVPGNISTYRVDQAFFLSQ